MQKNFKEYRLGLIFILPAVIAIFLVIVYPVLRGIVMSFKDLEMLKGGTGGFVGIKNYLAVFEDEYFAQVFKNTIVWTLANTVIQISLGLGVALVLNSKIKGRGIYRTFTMVPWVIPSVVSALTWRWMYNWDYGLFNAIFLKLGFIESPISWLGEASTAMPSVIVASVWKGLPFVTVMLLAALQPIPEELYESASIDGGTLWQKLIYITIPMIKRTLAIATVLTVIFTVNNFNAIWLLTRGGPLHSTDILFTHSYKLAFIRFNFGKASAVAVMLFLFLSIFGSVYLYLIERE